MTESKTVPYGAWASPLSARDVAAGAVRLAQPQATVDAVFWTERRPSEGGRTVVVCERDGEITDLTPLQFNVRSRVHEYGGGAYRAFDGSVIFSNDSDGGIYVQPNREAPHLVLAEPGLRFADFDVHPSGDWVACVREDHRRADAEPQNTIVAVHLASGEQRVLAEGADFYAYPRFSPGGGAIAWISWHHPNMPWDRSELWTANVDAEMSLTRERQVSGSDRQSVIQPAWRSDGSLWFLSDRTEWWNLYRTTHGEVGAVTSLASEIGGPLWNLGTSWYGFDADERVLCIVNEGARKWLATVTDDGGSPQPIDLPFTSLQDLSVCGTRAVAIAGSPDTPTSVIEIDIVAGKFRIVRQSCTLSLAPEMISHPEPIAYEGSGGRETHAFYYPPTNPDVVAPTTVKPPLIVKCHGGPTGQTATTFDPEVQFWTSRGFGVVDVDYGGSTGYGRPYRERLNGHMGEVDVDDCVAAALYLAARGDVDPQRLVIRGGSAGGYVVLAALAFRDAFAAGASYYGIGDLLRLREITHKFESRYEDRLVGPYPERADLYQARSPLFSPDRITSPVIFFQGLEDPVVPPDQAESMVDALRARGVPLAYLTFRGEGHGFRRVDTIERCLQAELSFYGRVLGFLPAGNIVSVPVENM